MAESEKGEAEGAKGGGTSLLVSKVSGKGAKMGAMISLLSSRFCCFTFDRLI